MMRPKYRGPYRSWDEGASDITSYSPEEEELLNIKTRKCFFESDQELAIVEEQLKKMQRKLKFTEPDGDCMFEGCCQNVLHPRGYNKDMCRRQAALEMALHPEVYYPFVESMCVLKTIEARSAGIMTATQSYNYECYITSLYRGTIWGDQTSLAAVARMWNVPISIIQPNGQQPINIFHKCTPRIVLVSNGGNELSATPCSHFSGSGNNYRYINKCINKCINTCINTV